MVQKKKNCPYVRQRETVGDDFFDQAGPFHLRRKLEHRRLQLRDLYQAARAQTRVPRARKKTKRVVKSLGKKRKR